MFDEYAVDGLQSDIYGNGFSLYYGLFERERLRELIALTSEGELSNIIIAERSLRFLFHPYDGGMDVILSSVEKCDEIKERFAAWSAI